MNVSLNDWLANGWLVEHHSSPHEIAELLEVADRELADFQIPNLSSDWKLGIAYNAGLQAANAALAASGYRDSHNSHHYRVIQSLTYTIGADTQMVNQFDRFRKKRNIGGYERAGTVSDMEAEEIFILAKNLRRDVEKWLRSTHPEFTDA